MLKIFIKTLFITMLLAVHLTASAQSRRVAGVVEDPNGEPIVGASVVIAGTTSGVATDIDGQFVLNNVSPSSLLHTYYI